jgi:hypothetical protein
MRASSRIRTNPNQHPAAVGLLATGSPEQSTAASQARR